jgi:myosin heavy subunit
VEGRMDFGCLGRTHVPDFILLDDLSEDAMFNNMSARYAKDLIYVCIILFFFSSLFKRTIGLKERAKKKTHLQTQPHFSDIYRRSFGVSKSLQKTKYLHGNGYSTL